MYWVSDAAYCYSVPHTVVSLCDFRHSYQHRSRRLIVAPCVGRSLLFSSCLVFKRLSITIRRNASALYGYAMELCPSVFHKSILCHKHLNLHCLCAAERLCRNHAVFFLNVTITEVTTIWRYTNVYIIIIIVIN